MLWLYDNAICKDLRESLDTENMNSGIKVIDPESAIDILAQIQDDKIKFPIIVLTREQDYELDNDRMNFTWLHKGIPASFDKRENNLYNEKVLPINLNYNLTVLATNTADRDELTKELLFKYIQQFFLTVSLPYESNRKVRFGIAIDPGISISQSSGTFQYLESGKLYQSIVPLRCEGCVLFSYTPMKMHHYGIEEVVPINP